MIGESIFKDAPIRGHMHSFLVATSFLINKNKHPKQLRKDFLVRWLPSINIWCTKCTTLCNIGTHLLERAT